MTPAEFRAARNALGLTITGMSRMLGVTPTHIRRLEMDPSDRSHRPVTKTVEFLLRAYLDGWRPPDWGYDLSAVARAKRNWDRKLRV